MYSRATPRKKLRTSFSREEKELLIPKAGNI